MSIRTLNDVFFKVVEHNLDRAMLSKLTGVWQPISSSQLQAKVYATARHLRSWGLGKGDRVAILSENRPEWAIADFATLLIGGIVVPIYATQTAEQCLYLLQHSEARVLFVSSQAQFDKVAAIRPLTNIERIIIMDDGSRLHDVIPMAEFIYDAKPGPDPELESLAGQIQPDDVATLIYTSGTTGTPKGVILTHGNIASNLSMTQELVDIGTQDVCISFLPLSHITARHVDYLLFYQGVTIAYCPFFDELAAVMAETRPTLFIAVPRVYEKISNTVQLNAKGIKHKILQWALGVGRKHRDTILQGLQPNRWIGRSPTGSSSPRSARSSAAGYSSFSPAAHPWASTLLPGMPTLASASTKAMDSPRLRRSSPSTYPASTNSAPSANPCAMWKSSLRTTASYWCAAPPIFKGYWNMPSETAAAFEDGWFKTGDIGAYDEEGFLSIIDRKKDLIKTSGGKFIAPQPIENALKANMFVGEAALLGERRRFPAVLIVPNFTVLEDWARGHGMRLLSHEELVKSEKVRALYQSIIDELNRNLAQYEKVKKVLLIPTELSVADGTLTPSMKLRRRKLEERYRNEIDALYSETERRPEAAPVGKR